MLTNTRNVTVLVSHDWTFLRLLGPSSILSSPFIVKDCMREAVTGAGDLTLQVGREFFFTGSRCWSIEEPGPDSYCLGKPLSRKPYKHPEADIIVTLQGRND